MVASCAAADTVHQYPSSKHVGRDWDKVVADIKKEEKEEKPEGDAALQQLFQQIYKDGSDDVKKAMAKSFVSPLDCNVIGVNQQLWDVPMWDCYCGCCQQR